MASLWAAAFWTSANIGDVASIVAKAAESAAALTPTSGGTPAPAATLGALVSAQGVLSFTGTATGNITVETSANGDLTFTRGTTTTKLTEAAFKLVSSLAEQSSSLVITAKGAPSIELLTTLDTSGATLSYTTVGDTAARLTTDAQSNTGAGTFLKVGIVAAVSDDSSISKLSTLSEDIGRDTVGLNITDTAANITADVSSNSPFFTPLGLPSLPIIYTHSYIDSTIGSNIKITGESSVYQVSIIDSINGNGSLNYSISDYLSEIADNYTIAKNADSITISNTDTVFNATVESIKSLLSLTNIIDGPLKLTDFVFTLRDTAQHLIDAAGTELYTAAYNSQNITVDPPATINEANTLVTMDLTYTISDTYAHFVSAGTGSAAVLGAYSLTVTGTAADIQAGQTNNAAFFNALDASDRLVVTGSAGTQTIKGTPGGDEIHGGAGDDIISGGNGQKSDSSDYLFGDEGNDTITADGYYGEIYGGNGDDTITAGDYSSVYGGEGNDTITAGGADIYGGTGDDIIVAGSSYIYGGDGNDTITAGDESVIYGNDGDDTITATTKSDVYGGAGNDTITAGVSNEIYGDDGDDTITGGGTIYGGAGADKITGTDVNDVFAFYGETADELTSESGAATGTFDFITSFSSGDSIQFDHISSLQLVMSGTTGTSVTAGALGLTASLSTWNGENSQNGTLLSIDIADASGVFDGTADMENILVGVTNPSLSVQGTSLTSIIPG